jgi:hypothetical protein
MQRERRLIGSIVILQQTHSRLLFTAFLLLENIYTLSVRKVYMASAFQWLAYIWVLRNHRLQRIGRQCFRFDDWG